MKIEKLKKDYRKNIIIVILVIMLIIMGVWGFVGSRAKYRYTASFPAVQGTINYKNGDISVLAIKLQQEDGTYLDSEDFPTSGYTLNTTESYCVRSVEGEGQVRQDVTLSYENKSLTINNLSKRGTKCFLYFDKQPTAKDVILANNTVDTSRKSGSFTGIFETNTAGTIFEGPVDDSGDNSTYFFAGANPNNWVKFGKEGTSDIYWRIIRINSDGTVRMIYNGTSMSQTGIETQINDSTYAFNTIYNDNAYVGYMYGATGQSGDNGYTSTHKNTNDSTIKTQVDTWYSTNLNKEEYSKHIDTNAGFCGDRKVDKTADSRYQENGYSTQQTGYAPWARLYSNGSKTTQTPNLKCNQTNDLYTSKSASRGNKALTYPVGLITSDEVVFAGGFAGKANKSYWLYTSQYYWTMSPCNFGNGYANVFCVRSDGHLIWNLVDTTLGMRPVINLKADTQLTGSGTTTDPYAVV